MTDTSLVVHWLTPDLGRIATVAKGARSPKSPFRGKLDLFFTAEFSFLRSRRSDLHILREINLLNTREPLRKNLCSLLLAAYGVSLIEQATESESPLPKIYELFTGLLEALPGEASPKMMVFSWEMKMLEELGMRPNLSEASLSAGAQQLLHQCLDMRWDQLSILKPSPLQLIELRQFLHGFLVFHLGKLPRGRNAALDAEKL